MFKSYQRRILNKNMDNLKFEDAIKELEDIAEKLEKGQISLEEATKAFERGIELKKICLTRLQEAESKIEILSRSSDGSYTKERFQTTQKQKNETLPEELF